MSAIMQQINAIAKRQVTIDALLEAGDIKKRNGDNTGWTLEPLYSKEDCDLGFVHIDTVEAGRCPEHVHESSVEYLIVVRGEVLFNLEGRDLRTIREGEVAVVPAGVTHHSKPLVDNTKMVYVCVPKDPGMENLTKRMRNGE